jgi:hypothetical protein
VPPTLDTAYEQLLADAPQRSLVFQSCCPWGLGDGGLSAVHKGRYGGRLKGSLTLACYRLDRDSRGRFREPDRRIAGSP